MDNNTVLYAEPDELSAAPGPGPPGEPRAAAALRPLAPGMRRLLFTASVLVLLAGIQLLVFTGQTGHFFAFTIGNPLAAAFLGAAYWAAVPIEALAGGSRCGLTRGSPCPPCSCSPCSRWPSP